MDRLVTKGVRDAHLRLYRTILLIARPVMMTAFFLPSPVLFLVALFVIHALVVPFTAFASSSLQIITPPHLRGLMSGCFLAVLGFVGLSIGPSMVGFVTTYVLGDEARLGLSIAIVGTTGTLLTLALLKIGRAHV